jgi:hypothetical protein
MTSRERLEQIRRSHKSARPAAHNPAWCHTHADLTIALAEIDRLRDALAAIAAPGPLDQCVWQTNCARKALET